MSIMYATQRFHCSTSEKGRSICFYLRSNNLLFKICFRFTIHDCNVHVSDRDWVHYHNVHISQTRVVGGCDPTLLISHFGLTNVHYRAVPNTGIKQHILGLLLLQCFLHYKEGMIGCIVIEKFWIHPKQMYLPHYRRSLRRLLNFSFWCLYTGMTSARGNFETSSFHHFGRLCLTEIRMVLKRHLHNCTHQNWI